MKMEVANPTYSVETWFCLFPITWLWLTKRLFVKETTPMQKNKLPIKGGGFLIPGDSSDGCFLGSMLIWRVKGKVVGSYPLEGILVYSQPMFGLWGTMKHRVQSEST